MTSRNRIPSNYCSLRDLLESHNIKISDIIKEMMSNGKDYERWFKNLLYEEMTESWFTRKFPEIICQTRNRRDYKRDSILETEKFGVCRSPFEFQQDMEISTLLEDWVKLKGDSDDSKTLREKIEKVLG